MNSAEQAALNAALAQLGDGDRSAAPRVFNALYTVLLPIARKRLNAGSDHEDVVQRTLIQLFAAAHDYDPQKSALGWALTLLGYECRTELTRRKRRPVAHAPTSEVDEPDPQPDAEAVLLQQENAREVANLLRSLSESDRQQVLLYFDDGVPLRPDEAPLATATFRKRKQRFREKLAQLFRTLNGRP
jgi:RNA polymerase sigma factor (sigma-70 family)